ncbi:MAG: hypothetical protein H8E34_05085 [Bacteroidetes bacterium]|nr:hypothetical protein [Bacteroidota bacterium]
MKIKVVALAFSLVFFASITATSFAQLVTPTNSITIVDNDQDKDKNKKKTKTANIKEAKTTDEKEATDLKDCKVKKSSCPSAKMQPGACKEKKSDNDKK